MATGGTSLRLQGRAVRVPLAGGPRKSRERLRSDPSDVEHVREDGLEIVEAHLLDERAVGIEYPLCAYGRLMRDRSPHVFFPVVELDADDVPPDGDPEDSEYLERPAGESGHVPLGLGAEVEDIEPRRPVGMFQVDIAVKVHLRVGLVESVQDEIHCAGMVWGDSNPI